jgi:hypothetical protein
MKELEIDKYNLDEEWLSHPNKFYEAALQAAEAKNEMVESGRMLDIVRAELDKEIRGDPSKFNIGKISEGIISSTIELELKYRKALSKFNKAKYKMNVMQALVDAYDHRKRALQDLVYLHGQNYFSSPVARTSEAKEAMKEVEKMSIRRRSQKKERG